MMHNMLIPNSKAVHDYVNSISTSLSVDIQNGAGKLVDGKAVKDYAEYYAKNVLPVEQWTFTTDNGASSGSIVKNVYIKQ